MKEKRFTTKQMVCAILLTAALSLGGVLLLGWALLGTQGLSVMEGFVLIRTLFVGEADLDEVADGALSGMVAATGDRWSYYLDPDWNEQQILAEKNTGRGIGVTILYQEEGLLVTDVVPGGGAAEAGIRKGEYLIAVDGQPLYGEKGAENVALVRGEEGTIATLTVRDAAGEDRTVKAKRGNFFSSPVRCEMLENQVGYIRLRDFHKGAAEETMAAIEELKSRGARAMIFDLRQNGGGFLNELTDLLDAVLPEGTVFRQKSSMGFSWAKKSDADCLNLPMATLVDAGSYSAAELFAAQLRESANAPIIGERTSGKGYFQYHFALPHGGGLGLSIGTYETGGGTSLANVGLTPDKEISLSEEKLALFNAHWLPVGEDPQLQAALEILQNS